MNLSLKLKKQYNLIFLFLFGILFSVSSVKADETIKFKAIHPSLLDVSGQLFLPINIAGRVPAVVIVHGTGGIDERTSYFAEQLPKQGVAAFVVDFKSGVFTSARDRPPNDNFLPAAFAALRMLREKPSIDPNRIAIIGFSLGGQLAVTTSLSSNKNKWLGDDTGFAAHVSFYPGCIFLDKKINKESKITSPIKIFWGTNDSYGDGEACPLLIKKIKTTLSINIEYDAFENGHHGFDGKKSIRYYDPAALKNDGYVEGNDVYAKKARDGTITFLLQNLK